MNCKLVQPVCTDITRLLECMHRFRVGRPNLNLRATNTHISDQMRSPRMIFGRIWRPGDRPFPALRGVSDTIPTGIRYCSIVLMSTSFSYESRTHTIQCYSYTNCVSELIMQTILDQCNKCKFKSLSHYV